MEIDVIRFSTAETSTLGLLLIDGTFECYTLEDGFHKVKIPGKTRIPAGTYALAFRNFGKHNEQYLKKYGGDFHHGMLQVMHVKGFTDILIHKGNTGGDTAGCLLVGDGANNNQTKDGFISSSGLAYEHLYPKVAAELLAGNSVSIRYRDRPALPQGDTPATRLKVNTKRLYLRSAPNGTPNAILFNGCEAAQTGSRNDWRKVKIEGWLSTRFIKKI